MRERLRCDDLRKSNSLSDSCTVTSIMTSVVTTLGSSLSVSQTCELHRNVFKLSISLVYVS